MHEPEVADTIRAALRPRNDVIERRCVLQLQVPMLPCPCVRDSFAHRENRGDRALDLNLSASPCTGFLIFLREREPHDGRTTFAAASKAHIYVAARLTRFAYVLVRFEVERTVDYLMPTIGQQDCVDLGNIDP
jgi:hypothetical protein